MINVTKNIVLHPAEIKFYFIPAPGPGGQNVNKVATAVQLRFDILHSSSLPEEVRIRLLSLLDNRITAAGEVVIKASCYRSQERNKHDAQHRLCELITRVATPLKERKKTRPTWASKQRRLKVKKLHGIKKSWRGGIDEKD